MNSSELRGFLTGLILGDGSIDKGVTKRAFRIKSTHPDFLSFIQDNLEQCSNFEIRVKSYPMRKSKDCIHRPYSELIIGAHPYFAKKYHHFYDDYRRRVVSKEAYTWINDIGLAAWYMSDGYMCLVGKTKERIRDRRVEICADRYSEDIVENMIAMLKEKFGLSCSKIRRGSKFRIRILKQSYGDFYKLVSPYIVPSMRYKLYFGYELKPEWMDEMMWDEQERLQSAMTLAA